MKKTYPSDLTNNQWNHIKELFETENQRGRPIEIDLRKVVNAILFILISGCQWRYLPKDFPNWQSVYYHFRKWKKSGQWKVVYGVLYAEYRAKEGRHKHATAGAIDSQSVKTTSVPSNRGFDAGKKITGRKRHILVDTLGLLIAVVVTVASIQDRDGARLLLTGINGSGKKLRKIWVDGGYRGELVNWVKSKCNIVLEVVLRAEEAKGFVLLPRRWVVERTFSWLNNSRRLSKDYERFCETSETFIYIAMTRLILLRLVSS
jgi:putative transposase